MEKVLYLMRHGQTLFNEQDKIQGWCDAPLTEIGKKQAQIAGAYFREHQIVFDHAYASTSERACDTLELACDMPYVRLKGLKELNFGTLEGEREPLKGKVDREDFFVAYGGEHMAEMRKRVIGTLLDCMRKPDHQCVLAVAHAGVCWQMIRYWQHLSRVDMQLQQIDNCSIFKFLFDQDAFHLMEVINHDFSGLYT